MPAIPGTKCWLNKSDQCFIRKHMGYNWYMNDIANEVTLKIMRRCRQGKRHIPAIWGFVKNYIMSGEWK